MGDMKGPLLIRIAFILFLLCNTVLWISRGDAGPENSIVGLVTDAETGDPVVGARVILLGTTLGAVTDLEGFYTIVSVPPGRYDVEASFLGYRSELVEGIEVVAARTVRVNFELQVTVVPLQEISVTASRIEKEIFYTPHAITIASEEEIEKRAPRTTPEILREETGVMIQKTTHGHGAPAVRGLMGYQVLILIDGMRLNNATFRYGPNQYLSTIDPHQVERIEVVRGPGSVLYGSDAQGGVINIITKKPGRSSGRFKTNLRINSKYASADEEKMVHLEVHGGTQKLGFSLGATLKDVGDLKAGGDLGVQSPTGWQENGGHVTLCANLNENQKVTWGYQAVRQKDVPRYDKYPGGLYATGKKESGAYERYLYTPQDRDLLYVDYKMRDVNSFINALGATLSFHRQKEGRDMLKEGETKCTKEEDVTRTWGFNLQLNSLYGTRHNLVYGLEGYRDKVGSERFDTDISTGNTEQKRGRYPDGASFESAALYLQDEIFITSNLAVSCGGRYSRFRLKADLDDSTFGSIDAVSHALTGSFGAVLGLTDNVNMTLGLAQAFRAPNIDDETTFGDFHAGIEVPSPGLEPEKSFTYELGFKTRYNTWTGSVTAYVTNLRDLIDREPSTYQGSPTLNGEQVWKKINVNRARVKGIEADIHWAALSEWSVFSNFARTWGRDLSGDEPLRRIPPAMGLLGVRWQPVRTGFWGECFIRFAAKQDELSSGDEADVRIPIGGTPGWVTCNARAGLRVTEYLRFTLGLENIWDEAYREHGSGVDGPGRNFFLHSEIRM